MYLVSPEYVAGRNQSPPMPAEPQQESRTEHVRKKKTAKHGRRRRITEEQHPYDRWVKIRSEMQEADIDRKTLIQKITDFLQKVLPNSNALPKQTVAAAPPPPPPPPPESPDTQKDFKSEAPASPSGTPFLPRKSESLFESPIKRSLSTDSEDEGAASYVPGESSVREFSTRHFGAIASPYVSAYVHRKGNLDSDYGMRRDADGTFRIGNAEVVIDQDSNVFVKGKSYRGTRGLFELLTRKKVDQSFITESDLQSYREILEATYGHLQNNDPAGVLKTARGAKFKDVISKLFPTGAVTRRRAQSTSTKPWFRY